MVFRKQRSTELASTLLIDDIKKQVDQGKFVGALFIDLSKAFDTLGHDTLISKLSSFGMKGVEIEWFSDYLFNRKQICEFNRVKSEAQSLLCGVPQGSILGPLMFLMYFNDFSNCLKSCETIQFADDTVIYTSDKSVEVIASKLNLNLKSIADYFHKNELIINLNKNKTESMLFGTAKRLSKCPDLNLLYNNSSILQTNTYKYLGTRIDPSLNLNDNFNHLYKQASAKLTVLATLKDQLTKESISKIYNGMIIPCLLYNCINNLNLSATQQSKLHSIDRRAANLTGKKVNELHKLIENHSVRLVRKCIDGLVCSEFANYFVIRKHSKSTRNNGLQLHLPKVRLEFAKSGFFSMGVKKYNSLPIEIRQTESFSNFRKMCNKHFLVS